MICEYLFTANVEMSGYIITIFQAFANLNVKTHILFSKNVIYSDNNTIIKLLQQFISQYEFKRKYNLNLFTQLLIMRCVFQDQDLQMFGLKLSKYV